MIKKLILMAVTLLLFACNKKSETTDTSSLTAERPEAIDRINTSSSEEEGDLKLSSFSFPAEVDGCSCYFSRNQQEFHDEKYVYLDDYGNNAYLNVDGKQVKIKMEEGDFDPENFSRTISNDEFTITIVGQKIRELEEVMMFGGKMTVEDNSGKTTTTPIYGECGC